MTNIVKKESVKLKLDRKKQGGNYSNELIKEIKESLADFKKGKYVKGDVNDIMKEIRNYENETDRNRKVH